LIGLETGLVNLTDTVFVWDSLPRRMDVWEKDMTLKEAFHVSCVPCYQELARKIGADRMNDYLNRV
jgi:beta-lactamase class D